jgi:hypothetical protein
MHYTTIDPKRSKIRTHDHALHHRWPPKMSNIRTHDHALHNHWSQNSNPRPCTMHHHLSMTSEKTKIRTHDMHYTTIDSHKFKDSNPGPCTTPPLTPKNKWFEPTTMHYTTIDPLMAGSAPNILRFLHNTSSEYNDPGHFIFWSSWGRESQLERHGHELKNELREWSQSRISHFENCSTTPRPTSTSWPPCVLTKSQSVPRCLRCHNLGR